MRKEETFPYTQMASIFNIAAAAAAAKSHQSCPTLLRPHRRQPTRLPRPWDSPGKNTGVGCHFLLQFELKFIDGKCPQSQKTEKKNLN